MDDAHVQCILFLLARVTDYMTFAYELSVVCSVAVSHCAVMCQSSVTARQIYLQIAQVGIGKILREINDDSRLSVD